MTDPEISDGRTSSKRQTLLWGGFGILVAIAALLNHTRSGIYVLETPSDRYVYWIDAVGTTLPCFILAGLAWLHILRRIRMRTTLAPPVCGFIAGWSVMIAFTLFVTSTPRHPELVRSSTIGIAIVLTPFIYAFLSILACLGTIAVISQWMQRKPVKNR